MKFAIMIEHEMAKPSILCREDGTELWFDSLQETLDFIRKYNIPIQHNSVINEFIGSFVINSYNDSDIQKLLENGNPDKEDKAGEPA